MNTIEISEISKNEVDKASIVLFQAFKNDPLMQWIFVDQKSYNEKGIATIRTWVNYAVLFGKAFRTNNFEAVALRKLPGDNKLTFWRMFRSGMLSTPSILGKESFKRLMHFDDLITRERKKNMGKQRFWYCWMIGTLPEEQHKGFGRALMNHTFELMEATQLPCYLETACEASKKIHMHKGYKILSELLLPESSIKITSMLKEIGCK